MAQPPSNLPFDPADSSEDASVLPPPLRSAPPVPPPAPAPAPVPPPPVVKSEPPAIQTMPEVKASSGPEDMFSGLDDAKKAPARSVVLEPIPVHKASWGMYIGIALAILVVVSAAGFGFWYFMIRSATPTTLSVDEPDRATTEVTPDETDAPSVPEGQNPDAPFNEELLGITQATPTLAEPVVTPPPGVTIPDPMPIGGDIPTSSPPVAPPVEVDTDGDTITDRREGELGTDPKNPDTDGDRLTDGEELLYQTNPLLADSDGDTYPDGVEVQGGYNPRGAGKCAVATCIP